MRRRFFCNSLQVKRTSAWCDLQCASVSECVQTAVKLFVINLLWADFDISSSAVLEAVWTLPSHTLLSAVSTILLFLCSIFLSKETGLNTVNSQRVFTSVTERLRPSLSILGQVYKRDMPFKFHLFAVHPNYKVSTNQMMRWFNPRLLVQDTVQNSKHVQMVSS